MLIVISGRPKQEEKTEEPDSEADVATQEAGGHPQGEEEKKRAERWSRYPREVRQALKRLHINLGHPSKARFLRALKIGKASAQARMAARDFL